MMRVFLFNTVMAMTVYMCRIVLCKAVNCSREFVFCREYSGLSRVPSDIPRDIIHISLDHNIISHVTGSPFTNNTKCTILSLDYNSLVEIRASCWVGLWELELLSLEKNRIHYIQRSAFSLLPMLQGLYLKENKLPTLSPNIFEPHPHPIELEMTLQGNPLEFDSRLCWLQGGMEDGWISWVDLDELDSLLCSTTEAPNNGITEATNISEDVRNITLKETNSTDATPPHYKPTEVTMETDLFVYGSVDTSHLSMDTLHWVFAVTVCIAVLVLLAVGVFCILRFNVSSCKGRQTSDASLEMQPCGMTTTTTTTATDNRNSEGYLLPVDEPTRPTAPSRSSGVYSYAYDHMRDRFIAFLSVHLRHIQDLYSRRNPVSNSRPSSVPPSQAPHPPGHTPPSSPLIPPSPPKGGDPGPQQYSSPSYDLLEGHTLPGVSVPPAHAHPVPHVTPVRESTCFYENDSEVIEYADVIACV